MKTFLLLLFIIANFVIVFCLQAVCCSDHEHCCPSGFTCDVPEQKCLKNDGQSIEWAKKLEVVPLRKVNGCMQCF